MNADGAKRRDKPKLPSRGRRSAPPVGRVSFRTGEEIDLDMARRGSSSKRRKAGIRISVIALAVLSALFAKLLYFGAMIASEHSPKNKNADVVLVYAGDPNRIPVGFQLADKISARWLVYSGRAEDIRAYRRQHRIPSGCAVQVVDGTYTTDQNARRSIPVVKSLLRGSDSKRVLLVTSWYHMPRAYFLTRLYAISSGITLDYAPAEPIPTGWWKRPELRSELLRFWGSLMRVGLAVFGIENWPRPAGCIQPRKCLYR
jgi:uncharacterized SAM-binding protein YcdF (DUF218 family)